MATAQSLVPFYARVFLLEAPSVSVLQYARGQTCFISPARELSTRTAAVFILLFRSGASTLARGLDLDFLLATAVPDFPAARDRLVPQAPSVAVFVFYSSIRVLAAQVSPPVSVRNFLVFCVWIIAG
jgi:hypothetical protein